MDALNELLTVVIPVKNEEKNLPACLENVREFEHVVLVDSGSSDRTVEIFEEIRDKRLEIRCGWEVVEFRWDGKFPKKRNWVLRNYKFKTPWVMFLDADERLTEEWKEEVERRLKVEGGRLNRGGVELEGRIDAWVCYYDNWFMGRMLKHGDVMRKTAILRVGKGEYERIEEDRWSKLDMEIHEHLQVEGKIGEIKARLEHHDKRSLESYYAKHEEYANWEANRYRELMKDPDAFARLPPRQKRKYSLIAKWWFGFAYFCACYFAKLGFLDGKAGLVFAWGKCRYFRNIRKKILRG